MVYPYSQYPKEGHIESSIPTASLPGISAPKEGYGSEYNIYQNIPQQPISIPYRPNVEKAPIKDSKLIIGIDFGTTYSGIAYALDNGEIRVINEWGGRAQGGRNDVFKVPSFMRYSPNYPHQLLSWGYKAEDDMENETPGTPNRDLYIKGVKLYLEPDAEIFYNQRKPNPFHDDFIAISKLTSTEDIVSEYIGSIYRHALENIKEREIAQHIDYARKEFVLTVPAIWSDTAKESTLRAARSAHVDLLKIEAGDLITEPEAASLYTFDFYQGTLSVGDSFTLCDAGGGTVDLTSYKIMALKPLSLKQIVLPSGDTVGSLFIDAAFKEHLHKILGEKQYDEIAREDMSVLYEVMHSFEKDIKRSFSSVEEWNEQPKYKKGITIHYDIKDDPENGIRGRRLEITGEFLQQLFDGFIPRIGELVREQLDTVRSVEGRPAEAIFLVGGFGTNPYLKKYLENITKVIQPPNGWAAIVKGAVLSKISHGIRVETSLAPKNYGVEVHRLYEPSIHPKIPNPEESYDDYEGIQLIPTMHWYIRKGEDLSRKEPTVHKVYTNIPYQCDDHDKIIVNQLQKSAARSASDYPWECKLEEACGIELDLRSVPVSEFTFKNVNGKMFYSITYEIVIETFSASLEFSSRFISSSLGTIQSTKGRLGVN